ncbi:DUF397 domain-containing protein [Actinomadura sp. 7K507]|uniref:DUF397 domain-containing protein n=1 Tax=Actinomadura sp. 7K507 TaxID=2530365 RepID=UPI001053E1BD|nr:DUF397 domain-containing protein [Actinomadura sp. 7K507]TDC93068.1 DUF397 domain-containing protein [Actinomadura sp. 7K507]
MGLSNALWRKSSRSTNNGGACVELASAPDTVVVRDSEHPEGAKLVVTRRAFAVLLAGLKEYGR